MQSFVRSKDTSALAIYSYIFIFRAKIYIWHFFFFFISSVWKRSHETRSSMSYMQIECSCGLCQPNAQMPIQTEIITTTKKYIGNCKQRRWHGWKWVFCFPSPICIYIFITYFVRVIWLCRPQFVCWNAITKERFLTIINSLIKLIELNGLKYYNTYTNIPAQICTHNIETLW